MLISTGTTWLGINIKELDVYVEELEGNSIYEIDSVKDYHKLEEILSLLSKEEEGLGLLLYEYYNKNVWYWLYSLVKQNYKMNK